VEERDQLVFVDSSVFVPVQIARGVQQPTLCTRSPHPKCVATGKNFFEQPNDFIDREPKPQWPVFLEFFLKHGDNVHSVSWHVGQSVESRGNLVRGEVVSSHSSKLGVITLHSCDLVLEVLAHVLQQKTAPAIINKVVQNGLLLGAKHRTHE